MKLPFRREREPRHPWGKENVLHGYVPGLDYRLDLFALIVSLCQSQSQLADAVLRVMKLLRALTILYAILAFFWIATAYRILESLR